MPRVKSVLIVGGGRVHRAVGVDRPAHGLYDNIRDFLVLHYHTAARRDTAYWRARTSDPLIVPPRVAEFVERWNRGEPVDPEHEEFVHGVR